jgi:hypothetical protein
MANIIVSGCSFELANGTYIDQGGTGAERLWTKAIPGQTSVTEFFIGYDSLNELWRIVGAYQDDNESLTDLARSEVEVLPSSLPWTLDWFENDGDGGFNTSISVQLAPEEQSENTFGLPADVVALITSRFGTVANFLRLRNQGQV